MKGIGWTSKSSAPELSVTVVGVERVLAGAAA
jgi:hypothetical protein